MDDYTNLKFASLFHDIGKFYQRADNLGRGNHAYDSKYENLDAKDYGLSGAHSKWSADFVRDNFDDQLISDESINSVMKYYNSRLDIYNQIIKEINDENFEYISVPLTKDNDTLDIYNNKV